MSLSRVRTPPQPPPRPQPHPHNHHHLFLSETLLPLALPISQHSWAMPHQSKGRFMGLMLQWVQTGLWDRMFGWYLALLKQTSHQNMITEGQQEQISCLTPVQPGHANVHYAPRAVLASTCLQAEPGDDKDKCTNTHRHTQAFFFFYICDTASVHEHDDGKWEKLGWLFGIVSQCLQIKSRGLPACL